MQCAGIARQGFMAVDGLLDDFFGPSRRMQAPDHIVVKKGCSHKPYMRIPLFGEFGHGEVRQRGFKFWIIGQGTAFVKADRSPRPRATIVGSQDTTFVQVIGDFIVRPALFNALKNDFSNIFFLHWSLRYGSSDSRLILPSTRILSNVIFPSRRSSNRVLPSASLAKPGSSFTWRLIHSA